MYYSKILRVILVKLNHVERVSTEIRITTKKKKENIAEALTEMKRSPDESHAEASLILSSVTVKRRCPYRVFTYIHSILIEKDICECRNVSVVLSCIYMCFSCEDLLFFDKTFLFIFLYSS